MPLSLKYIVQHYRVVDCYAKLAPESSERPERRNMTPLQRRASGDIRACFQAGGCGCHVGSFFALADEETVPARISLLVVR